MEFQKGAVVLFLQPLSKASTVQQRKLGIQPSLSDVMKPALREIYLRSAVDGVCLKCNGKRLIVEHSCFL